MAGRKVSISVDTADFVKLLQSGEALFLGDIKNVKHDKLLQYASFDELVEDSEDDMEMARLVKVVKAVKVYASSKFSRRTKTQMTMSCSTLQHTSPKG